MEPTILLIDLLAAGALLVWGLKQLKSGVLSGLGASLRSLLAAGTRTRFHAALSGLVVTISMQSSTATALIASTFADRGMIRGKMAQAVMLGANLGTALAAVILSMDIHWLASVFVLTGVVAMSRGKTSRGQGMGKAAFGLGIMLLALHMMSGVTEPLRDSVLFANIVAGLAAAPIFALIFAIGLAAAATSSLAAVVFIAFLSQTGQVPPSLVVVFVAGANIGGAIPPVLAAMQEGLAARRLTVANLAVRAFGGIVMSLFAADVVLWSAALNGPLPLGLEVHLLFNLALLLVFLPWVGGLEKLVKRLVPAPESGTGEIGYLDEASLATPSLALAGASREALRMGDEVCEMLEVNLDALLQNRAETRDKIARLDDSIDFRLRAIKLFLLRLRKLDLSESETRRCDEILSYAINLEHVGDIVESHLCVAAEKLNERQVSFSPEGLKEIRSIYQETVENLQLAQSVFLSRDPKLAMQLMAAKVEIRKMEQDSSLHHLARIEDRKPEALETSSIHLDILRDLKRINAHLATPAYSVLDEIGALRESRVRRLSKFNGGRSSSRSVGGAASKSAAK